MSAFINEIFAPALTIAERLKPLRGCTDWEQAAGHYGAIKEPLLMLRDCLKEIGDSLDHVPNALHEPIKTIARIAKGTETECVSIGDVCIYLANADLEGPALQGWKAILAEKPDAKNLYPWASQVMEDPQDKKDFQDFSGESITDPIRLSITEAATFIGVTDRTIRDWRKKGKLTAVDDGSGQLLFSKSSLEILRNSRK